MEQKNKINNNQKRLIIFAFYNILINSFTNISIEIYKSIIYELQNIKIKGETKC